MSNNSEGLYEQAVKKHCPSDAILENESLDEESRILHFAMNSNGQFGLPNGNWKLVLPTYDKFVKAFKGEKVAFYGPTSTGSFFKNIHNSGNLLSAVLNQPKVLETISKYKDIDEDLGARISFVLGGIVRHFQYTPIEHVQKAVEFAARMTKMGDEKSADIIACSIAMYVMSGGSVEPDNDFSGNIYRMAGAISSDPIDVLETKDLGISQVARIRALHDPRSSFPDISEQLVDLEGFPTVGAEFHLPPYIATRSSNFWQRLALLNMSQHRKGSYVQFSRNDRDVIEVRMNPSFYPITIANWEHLRVILPELNDEFFTVTLNRTTGDGNLDWKNNHGLLNAVRAVGLISYAGDFEKIPASNSSGEIDFGDVYLGQTVRVNEGQINLDGNWGGGEGDYGQIGIYAGFNDNLPNLAYYLSMVLKNPELTLSGIRPGNLPKIRTLNDAFKANDWQKRQVLTGIQERVKSSPILNRAYNSGNKIMELLSPMYG